MTDHSGRLLLEIQGFAGSLEAGHVETLRMLALQLDGHPKAQDFEPSGHGGGEARSPLRFDKQGWPQPDSQAEGKKYTKAIQRAWEALREADDIRRRNMKAERQKATEAGVDDIWCHMHRKFEVYNPIETGGLCRPCYERRGVLAKMGLELTHAEVQHHSDWRNHGRWPKHLVDSSKPGSPMVQQSLPGQRRIAGLENLVDGTANIQEA